MATTATGGPVTEAIETATTLPALVRAAAEAYGEATAMRLAGAPVEAAVSFAGLEERSAILARGLIARGVGKGTRVGFIYGNGPEFMVVLAAVARAGAVAIPISTLLKADELVRVLRQSDVACLLVQRTLLGHDLVARLCDALPDLRHGTAAGLRIRRTPFLRWVVSSGDGLPAAIRPIEELLAAGEDVEPALLDEIAREIHPADQLLEIYTSGSMALPKGVRHDHGPVMFRARYLRDMIEPERGTERIVPLPMFWVGGLMMAALPYLAAGVTSVCSEAITTDSSMAMGSVLSPESLARMSALRPYWALGMSETLGPYAYGDVFRVPERPVCAPLDHVADGFELRVVDEAQREVADGRTGEIQIRGYPLTPGLHKIERSSLYTADGFYRTGDLGLVDGARVHFVGRDGDMIKSAGSNVSPAEVELEMQRLDGIEAAYVVGLPDPVRGQLVAAAVVASEGETLDFEQIRLRLRARLSPYKVPGAYVLIGRDEVPMLHSNKVAKRSIQAMVAERLTRPPSSPAATPDRTET